VLLLSIDTAGRAGAAACVSGLPRAKPRCRVVGDFSKLGALGIEIRRASRDRENGTALTWALRRAKSTEYRRLPENAAGVNERSPAQRARYFVSGALGPVGAAGAGGVAGLAGVDGAAGSD